MARGRPPHNQCGSIFAKSGCAPGILRGGSGRELRSSDRHGVRGLETWGLHPSYEPPFPGERQELLRLAKPAAIVADWPDLGDRVIDPAVLLRQPYSESFPSLVSDPGRAICSGGSTGTPKIIVRPGPLSVSAAGPPKVSQLYGFGWNQVQLAAAAMHHNASFTNAAQGLAFGHLVVLMQRFDPGQAVELIERHRVQWMYVVPTMMKRIIELPDIRAESFASIEVLYHTAAPCPAWLKRAWLSLLGPRRVVELYGSSEATAFFVVRGNEWLERPGTVGKPIDAEVKIVDAAGQVFPVGQVGEIFVRSANDQVSFYYLGTDHAKTLADGYVSVGDMGSIDTAGYLYIADRADRHDRHRRSEYLPCAGGRRHERAPWDRGRRSYRTSGRGMGAACPRCRRAARSSARPPELGLREFLGSRLSREKIPKTYEFVTELPRDEAGKLRRSALRSARLARPTC